MTTGAYFDLRDLAWPMHTQVGCPISGCDAPIGEADSPWGKMPYCPEHRIRIHKKTRTFVYYNGPDAVSRRDAALRNILFERNYFDAHILGNAAKAETHRICHETSEDALTWNVFSRIANSGSLPALLSTFTGMMVKNDPELYLWGLPIRFHDSAIPTLFPPLKDARNTFEKDIKKFQTEPDILLYVPGQLLVLIEAKLISGNTVASSITSHDRDGEKPKSHEGILRRYTPAALPHGVLLASPSSGPFYSQLYRNLVFAIFMADKLKVRWCLVNLVSERQFHRQQCKVEFQDPTQFIHALLPETSRDRFRFCSWEQVYRHHVVKTTELEDLAEYMYNKSARGIRALCLDDDPTIH